MPSLYFGEPEGRIARTDRDVARGDQPDAAATHRAMHPGNGRLLERVERVVHPRRLVGSLAVLFFGELGAFLHVLDIGAGAEALALPHQHHRAHFRVGFELPEHSDHLRDHFRVKCVVQLGAVERDRRIAVLVDQRKNLFGHFDRSSLGLPALSPTDA